MRPNFLFLVLLVLSPLAAQCQHQFKVLHAFGTGKDGGGVWDSVVFDQHGNLYGTTSGGGAYGQGIVFELLPRLHGKWAETVLHNFPSSPDDGQGPVGGVILDNAGGVYGTTVGGGTDNSGTVFELTPGSHSWTETILYSFCVLPHCSDGGSPWGNLIMDRGGNLYGTGYAAFELSPGSKGWIETALHLFAGNKGDGFDPRAGPIRDAAGNLYGTTVNGGGRGGCIPYGCGTVYELRAPANEEGLAGGAWKEHVLHRFGSSAGDGWEPGLGQLAMDPAGSLYGTTITGDGNARYGTVFKLTRVSETSNEVWRERILYRFTGSADGFEPSGGVILDNAGSLYGTTIAGGSPNCGCGVVFKLSPQTDGSWKYTLLHTFVGSDGAQPDANLALGPDGKLYGTAATGGRNGFGVVFQLNP